MKQRWFTINIFLLIGLCISFMASGKNKKMDMNTFDSPDFAFPTTVERNADVRLNKVLSIIEKGKGGVSDYSDALRASIQVVIARGLSDGESFNRNISLIDSVASIFNQQGEYGHLMSGVCSLLEAQMYADLYNSQRWKFNQRSLPELPLPSSPMEWSGNNFSYKIRMLVEQAMRSAGKGINTPVEDLKGVVSLENVTTLPELTVNDFMVLKSINILQSISNLNNVQIPFGKGAGDSDKGSGATSLSLSILNKAIAGQEEKGGSPILERLLIEKGKLLTGEEREKFYSENIARYITTPYCGIILANSLNDQIESINQMDESLKISSETESKRKSIYAKAKEYLNHFPDNNGSSELSNICINLERKNIFTQFPQIILPGEKQTIRVNNYNVGEGYLLIYKVNDKNWLNGIDVSELISLKPVEVVNISNDGKIPFVYSNEYQTKPLSEGCYAVVPSATATGSGIYKTLLKNSTAPTFAVTGISVLISNRYGTDDKPEIYVVDGKTQKPLANVEVSFIQKKWRQPDKLERKVSTDSNGAVTGLDGQYTILAKRGKSFFYDSYYSSNYQVNDREITEGTLLTDLSIYHPGDSIGFTAVVWNTHNHKQKAVAGKKVKAGLYNANMQKVDSLMLDTDRFGRCSGKMIIPDDGLLGNYFISVDGDKDNRICGASVEVAEYKAPTFIVEIDGLSDNVKQGDLVSISGKARTYSGMPVASAQVSVNVKYIPWRWNPQVNNATYGTSATTDSEGNFTIQLPTERLKDYPIFCFGKYQLNIDVTSGSGETVSSSSYFSIGESYEIYPSIPEKAMIEKGEVSWKVNVLDMLGKPVKREVDYKIFRKDESGDEKPVMSGSTSDNLMKLSLDKFSPGRYVVRLDIPGNNLNENGENSVNKECEVVLYSKDGNCPPVKTALWVDNNSIIVPAGEKHVKVKVGTSYPDEWILCVVSDSKKLLFRKWLPAGKEMREIEIDAPSAEERITVQLCGMYSLKGETASIVLIPEEQTEKMSIKAVSFRDKIYSGGKETWKFKYYLGDAVAKDIAAIAVMSDKALNSLSPFRWNFNPSGNLWWQQPVMIGANFPGNERMNFYISAYRSKSGIKVYSPMWESYGYSLYPSAGDNIYIRGTRMMKSSITADSSAGPEAVYEESEEVYATGSVMNQASADSDGGNAEENQRTDETLRMGDTPLAFFMPDLVADSEGVVTVTFNVPDFNTTWQLQMAGYTADMKSCTDIREIVASKPLMVSINSPQFVRTGDLISIPATVYNNSDNEISVKVRLELFDPVDGTVVASSHSELRNLAARGSDVVRIKFEVPDNVNKLAVKCIADTELYSDGEQRLLPVMPASTPVVESQPFYLGRGEGRYEIKGKKIDEGTSTLLYCSNPIWECVLALPAMSLPESDNLISNLVALYGNSVASGLADRHKEIGEALKLYFNNPRDSSIRSQLEKNSQLKIFSLSSTPWVNNASSETDRMMQLQQLVDSAGGKKNLASMLDKILKKQGKDGGWSWCDGMPSSEYITRLAVGIFGTLNMMDFLPGQAKDAMAEGVRYCDREWLRMSKEKYFQPGSMLGYLYSRNNTGVVADKEFTLLQKKAIKEIAGNWRELGLFNKATAAILLNDAGYKMEARAIIESLRQYATQSKEKGMWWNTLNEDRWYSPTPLYATARILEAIHRINPDSELIDPVRQWILLGKQTGDWGADISTAYVIYSLLETGSDWLRCNGDTEIMVNGVAFDSDSFANLTGSATVSLPLNQDNIVSIEKNGDSPAWGGIVNQYVEKASKVKDNSIPELSIRKNVYLVKETAGGTVVETASDFAVGDKVRVTLTIINDRELDYMAINDNRSASFMPADQLSGYMAEDNLWMYREVRKDATNIFIYHLPKGTHVISYDCFVEQEGEFTLGIATAQSQYSPLITAHSKGSIIKVANSK